MSNILFDSLASEESLSDQEIDNYKLIIQYDPNGNQLIDDMSFTIETSGNPNLTRVLDKKPVSLARDDIRKLMKKHPSNYSKWQSQISIYREVIST